MLEDTFSTVCHQSAMCVRAQGYQQALTASRLQTMKNCESTNEVLSVRPTPAPLPDRKCIKLMEQRPLPTVQHCL